MTTTHFDIAVRTLECSRCGAPIAAPLGGGQTTWPAAIILLELALR